MATSRDRSLPAPENRGRKLVSRSATNLPDHLKYGSDEEEDVTKPTGGDKDGYMHQSIFSMITAAGHRGQRTDFTSRFDEDPSESEEDNEDTALTKDIAADQRKGKGKDTRDVAASMDHVMNKSTRLRPIQRLGHPSSLRERQEETLDLMSKSQILPDRTAKPDRTPRAEASDAKATLHDTSSEAPVLSRMISARAEMEASQPDPVTQKPDDEDVASSSATASHSLAEQLREIFSFDEAEKVIAEYPCWLLQTVLLQGYMYITSKHVCFYAYLPKKDSVATKSGYLAKQRNRGPNPLYKRYWIQLKGDVLSYYSNPAEPYFPAGHVDLRYAISAKVIDGKDNTNFMIDTAKRVYRFKAESSASAREWVKNLQKVIFRSRNDGDSVKVSIPVDSILEVDKTTALDFADTIKLQFIDNNETFVLDEYLFSFFNFGDDAYNVLYELTAGNELHVQLGRNAPETFDSKLPNRDPLVTAESSKAHGPTRSKFRIDASSQPPDSVPGPQSSRLELSSQPTGAAVQRNTGNRKGDVDRGRSAMYSPDKSLDSEGERRPAMSPLSSKRHDSSDSFAPETETESSGAIQSLDDTNASASQMLEASTLFRPTARGQYARSDSQSSVENNRRGSEDTARSHEGVSAADLRRGRTDQPPFTTQSTAHIPIEGHDGVIPIRKQASGKPFGLGNLVQAGSPLGLASNITEYMKKRSKDMSSLLATETMGYYEKVSGMWAGQRKHYGGNQALIPDDEVNEADDEEATASAEARFRGHFGLPESEQLRAAYYAHVHRVLPLYGKIYISNKHFCFRPLIPGTRFKVVLPFTAIENTSKERSYRPGYYAFMIVIRGFEELFFDFRNREDRDDCVVNLLQLLEQSRYLQESELVTKDQESKASTARAEHHALLQARKVEHTDNGARVPKYAAIREAESDLPPVLFDDPRASILNFKPKESLRITCLTIGSRGDVQPYIALCKGLLADGHRPRIATHPEFGSWIELHGIEFQPVAGDPAELMRICVENGMFTLSFLKEASAKFRGWIDELLTTAWQACQDSDLLIESPSAMGGIHIAEALQIPYFRAFSMPWTRTRAYPHAFAVPERKMGGYYNYMSYVMFDQIFWKAIAGQVNRWRKKELTLGATSLDLMQPNKVPFLYSFSPSVVVPPLDYSDWIRVTGYWFLDEGAAWTPPGALAEFIRLARQDNKKLVYIGFGSIVVENPVGLTKTVVEAVLKADVRCILSKGWSDRLGKKDASKVEIPLPPEILQIQSAPHDWLFKQMDAAAHHGGAGTTGASLRAGIPTIIKPFFGDQFFFGSRVEDLGVGICMKKVNTTLFSQALWHASHDGRMKEKAAALGRQIRKEDGVGNAIQAIYRDMEYAKSLVKRHKQASDGVVEEPAEETWTFIGDDSDAEPKKAVDERDVAFSASPTLHQRGSSDFQRASDEDGSSEEKDGVASP